ncbi:hypothetical protein ABZ345_22775 [Lentzea sp. NPDC005914]|uniref:hypothetical protein n=1 Tax=Lentzea sp. NPDC005914 TaxID=3154572 RepID=UPI0034070434
MRAEGSVDKALDVDDSHTREPKSRDEAGRVLEIHGGHTCGPKSHDASRQEAA